LIGEVERGGGIKAVVRRHGLRPGTQRTARLVEKALQAELASHLG
jgi:hypothetical protein